MSWRVITKEQIEGRFSPAELVTLKQIQGGDTNAALALLYDERLNDSRLAFLGAMAGAGYSTVDDGTVPDQIRHHVQALAVWMWLTDFPRLIVLMTDARKKAAEDAQKALESIAKRQAGSIEEPTDVEKTGNWNAERKLVPRTHPLPTPAQQFPSSPNFYANPNAVQDT